MLRLDPLVAAAEAGGGAALFEPVENMFHVQPCFSFGSRLPRILEFA
jgi:hypothetical protein